MRTNAALIWIVAMLVNGTASAQSTPVADERVVAEMLQLARVGAGDVVYLVGSTATVPSAGAERLGARVVGVGADRRLTAAYAEATVVILDLTPPLNLRLEPILRQQLRPGSRIVSHRFGIGAWRADDSVKASDGTTLFLWTVPRPPSRTPDIFFVPTDQRVVEEMLDLAGVTSQDVVHDLGSGDGRIVVIAAQKYGARGVGVEIDPALVGRARQVAREAQLADKVTFVEGDLFDADLSGATVVTLFLSDRVNQRLEAKLKRELKPGARVVSHQFRIGDWVPDRTVTAADGTSLFLWVIRAR
jgi:hypothetical protein